MLKAIITKRLSNTIFPSKTTACFAPLYLVRKHQRNYSSENEIEDRYREKLLKMAKSKGLKTIEDLKNYIKNTTKNNNKGLDKINPLIELDKFQELGLSTCSATEFKGPIKSDKQNVSGKPFKTLNSYIDVNKVNLLSTEEIEYIWRAKWAHEENYLSAVITARAFERMYKHIKQSPCFILPLPRQIKNGESDL